MKMRILLATAAVVLFASYAKADAIPYGSPGTPITTSTDVTVTTTGPIDVYFYGSSAADTDYIEVYDVTTTAFLYYGGNPSNIEFFDNQTTSVGAEVILAGASAGNELQFELVNATTSETLTSDPATNGTYDPGKSNAYVTPYTTVVNGIPEPGTFVGMEDESTTTGSDFDYNDDQYVFSNVQGNNPTVPEPSSLLLLGTGLLGLAFVAFRKVKSSSAPLNLCS